MEAEETDNLALIRDDLVNDRALTAEDPDRLNHGPIAERVLDLVTVSDPPVNVALFGAWGSGKSSFSALLERGIKARLAQRASRQEVGCHVEIHHRA